MIRVYFISIMQSRMCIISREMMLDISLFINSSEYRYTDHHYLVGVRKLTPTYTTHGKGHLHKPIPEVLVLKYDGLLLLL